MFGWIGKSLGCFSIIMITAFMIGVCAGFIVLGYKIIMMLLG